MHPIVNTGENTTSDTDSQTEEEEAIPLLISSSVKG